eukprot:scaffold48775_cov49-Cyclotella_meneghiniana.AAC.2
MGAAAAIDRSSIDNVVGGAKLATGRLVKTFGLRPSVLDKGGSVLPPLFSDTASVWPKLQPHILLQELSHTYRVLTSTLP